MDKYIPWIISGISLFIAVLTFFRNGSKDKKSDIQADDRKFNDIEKSLLKANLKLDQLCTTTTETRTDIKSLNKDIMTLNNRVSVVERDVQTAFNRIDELKEKVNR